jgi:hypothetical protein
MAPTTTSTLTTQDVPVLPDSHVTYVDSPPAGEPHAVYEVSRVEPTRLEERLARDTRVGMHLPAETVLRALLTAEFESNPDQVESLRRSQQQAERGEVRWLPEDDSPSGATESE